MTEPKTQVPQETDEEKQARYDQALARSNVLLTGQVIAESAQLVRSEMGKRNQVGNLVTPLMSIVGSALVLSSALLANRRTAAMVYRKGVSVNRITKVIMERQPLPSQIGQAPAAGEAGPASPTDAAPAQSAELVVRPPDPPRPPPEPPVEKEWELITDDLPPPVISCGSQGADEERAGAVLAMALEAEADKGKDQMTSALMRALARSRGPR